MTVTCYDFENQLHHLQLLAEMALCPNSPPADRLEAQICFSEVTLGRRLSVEELRSLTLSNIAERVSS
jgi:hypothetical protein